jgi:hypothetical protein
MSSQGYETSRHTEAHRGCQSQRIAAFYEHESVLRIMEAAATLSIPQKITGLHGLKQRSVVDLSSGRSIS